MIHDRTMGLTQEPITAQFEKPKIFKIRFSLKFDNVNVHWASELCLSFAPYSYSSDVRVCGMRCDDIRYDYTFAKNSHFSFAIGALVVVAVLLFIHRLIPN